MTEPTHSVLSAPDGHEIRVQTWHPIGDAVQVIQVLHGLGEHAGRYAEFAAAASARNCVVCCHDHRGHGSYADKLGHFSDNNGWNLLVNDALDVHRHLRQQYPGLPLQLLGHSMGSYIAQYFAMQHGGALAALVLSASTWPSRLQLRLVQILALAEARRIGRRNHSALLHKIGFENFNRAFQPARTEFDWLSRDLHEVDRYVDDPLCGGPYSCALWLDLIAGLLAISSRKALQKIAPDLPTLITGGAIDPVGGTRGMTALAEHYMQSGHRQVRLMIYPQGRHEMLHETNREQVTKDWLDWLQATSRSGHSN